MRVLIAQLGTPSRWGQFSPHFEIVRDYFGAEPDEHLQISLRAVSALGHIGPVEDRVSIPKDSKNWSFELGEAGKDQYPEDGARPVVVFLRRNDGSYVYSVLMPEDPPFGAISGYLVENSKGPAREIPQVITSEAQLRALWPNSPLLN